MTHYQKSCRRLKNAITALSLYTQQNQKKIYSFFSRFFPSKEDKTCLHAIDEIKTHRSLIQRLQFGTEEQKNLAKAALNAIRQYNEAVSSLNRTRKWNLWKSIELSLPITTIQESREEVQKTAELMQEYVLTREETDVFRMKGITLLSHFYPSIASTQESIRNAPITTHIDQLARKLSVSTILKPLPGENCVVKGAFHFFPNKKRSVPKSFELSFEATQNAFPDPLQVLGCLSDTMIPPCPLRVEEMPALARCLAKKAAIAHGLLPKGEYNLRAKEQLQQKQRLFQEHHDTLLTLHLKLMSTLVKEPLHFHQSASIVETKDHQLKVRRYDDLVILYRSFIEEFIDKPTDHLLHEWFENHTISFDTLSNETAHPANQNLKILANALRRPCQTIILQHLSENLEFMPPELNPFETKLQTLLYRQLLTFFAELERDRPLTIKWVGEQLLLDISLMANTIAPLDPITQEAKTITEELKHYYESRYLLRTRNIG